MDKICDCPCHTYGGMHIMPCCGECPKCGERIKTEFGLEKHVCGERRWAVVRTHKENEEG